MEAKLKAYEIFEKFWLISNEYEECKITVFEAKQCSKILVNEILSDPLDIMHSKWMSNYWEEVLKEIDFIDVV